MAYGVMYGVMEEMIAMDEKEYSEGTALSLLPEDYLCKFEKNVKFRLLNKNIMYMVTQKNATG